ncbi:uncharacterized protein LOC123714112 [Pieris brassicae]|uniref:uncharacterized protein LOC123714112 n=1 Tax=Pieris brassicae TaxID=7116 RepID=UPI001E6618F7|nr:uncharacterized protein LOC123714112 [Pieris brassicae]XP_045524205.1 uncharacterized protein LOC123714112 [Pieris brassicae]
MAVPHITSFCWCMGLEAGCKFIGFVHLLTSLSLMVVCSIYAEGFRAFAGTAEDAGDHVYSTWYVITTTIAVLSVVHVLLASALLYGAYTRSSRVLRGWVFMMCALSLSSLLYILGSMPWGFSSSGSEIYLAVVEGVFFYGSMLYCILCVNSFYLMLKSTEDMRGPCKADY